VSTARRLGVLGGTFDPVHVGHLDAANAALTALTLDHVLLAPSRVPPHRAHEPRAGVFHRFAMVALAIADAARLRASDVELLRDGPSYTVDTLRGLHRRGWAPSQIFFIVGADAFAEIATWREYPGVLDAANFAVIARRGVTLEEACARAPGALDRVSDEGPHGSATRIHLVEADTRDVSSTVIRARLAEHRSIEDLVPAAVARHITTHNLYGAADALHATDQNIGH